MTDAADFDAVAALYASARPSYPQESVDWVLGDSARTIIDVGAGTGLFTRLLLAPGRTVIAVEPAPLMLAELRAALPRIAAVQGAGERIPLADASADVVSFAQAWHWVDSEAASVEAARVLRPGGHLGLIWNLRDERVGWVRDLGGAMRADGDHYRGAPQDPTVFAPFGEPERSYVPWIRLCTRAEMLADVRSRSYFGLLSPGERAQVLGAVGAVLDAAPRSAGCFEVPYVTASFRYLRP